MAEQSNKEQPVSATASPTPDTAGKSVSEPVTPSLVQALKAAVAKHADEGMIYAEYIYLPNHKGEKKEPLKLHEVRPKGEKIQSLKFEDMPKGAIGYRTYTRQTLTVHRGGKEEVILQAPINYSSDTIYLDATGHGSISELTDEYVATKRVTGQLHITLEASTPALDLFSGATVALGTVLGRKILIEGSNISIVPPSSQKVAPTLVSGEGLYALIAFTDEDTDFVVVPLNAFDIIKNSNDKELFIVPPAPIKGTPTKENELHKNPVEQHKGPWAISTGVPEVSKTLKKFGPEQVLKTIKKSGANTPSPDTGPK